MPVQNVDFVPECGAYKQRIQKELRSLRPRDGCQPSIGPYAIPDKLPPELQQLLDQQGGKPSTSGNSSVASSTRRSRTEDRDVIEKLQQLERQISEEREGRKAVEAQLDRLQALLENLAVKEQKK